MLRATFWAARAGAQECRVDQRVTDQEHGGAVAAPFSGAFPSFKRADFSFCVVKVYNTVQVNTLMPPAKMSESASLRKMQHV